VREFNNCRGSFAEFNHPYKNARKFNDNFFEYLRMSTATYALLEKLKDNLSRKKTNFRKAISAEERLVTTLK
jgi:hypothetical protein